MVDESFPKRFRLTTPAEFDRVFASRCVVSDDLLIMHGVANTLELTRLGLSVSRKVGNAVLRNRWKRLIREVFRRARPHLPAGFDLVLRPKPGAVPAHDSIALSLPALMKRLLRRMDKGQR